ncbi:hypothetical protein [Nostoc sp. NMS4]|uniref:hypothetical protein n=1 Tax=Nostoc sp. NMS4 TaxID=2815390 RepID=UPI0025E6CAEF|nr:hypothetical protein [Nostoc sp. NMS4]MBN3925626.1 hypothetical protein [Nostoc sp. NMS4]
MKITDILPEIGSPVAFHPELVPVVGSHEAAVFICQLTYWTGKQHNRDGWIYKTQEEWFFETSLTEKQQQTARELLVERGYVEQRLRGIPGRLEYRLIDGVLSAVWETWMIASRIKKQFKNLIGMYGVLLSRGIQNEEIQSQMEKFREVVRSCHVVANQFFRKCREEQISPLSMIDSLHQNLSLLAETLGKFSFSRWENQASPNGRYKDSPYGETSFSPTEIQVSPIGISAPPSNPVRASAPDPSKTTAKTTSYISQESSQQKPDFSLLKTQPLNFSQEKKNKEVDQGFVNTVEVEVLDDTQQELEGKELNSQGQDCIFMKKNIPGGAGGENFEISQTPNWVQEYEDKVRSGQTLPRSELVKLAEHRLGADANVYRESGRVLDASPNDLKMDFLKFLQWHSFDRNPDIAYVRACVNKAERDPERWGVLLSWISTFKEVLNDPSVLGTMLAAKVSSAGRNGNKEDLALNNRLVLQNVFKK